MILLLSGIICNWLAVKVNNNNYDALVQTVDSMESYKQAIQIYPGRTEAYLKILENYEDGGVFGKAENDEFLALYNANRGALDKTEAGVAELNYKIGMMYFNYYTNDDGSYSFANRVQKAYPFFAENFKNTQISPEFEEKKLSDCYYQICSFYKSYILSSAKVEEASKKDYESLLKTMETALRDVEEAGAYDQLTLYNGIVMLLYDQRVGMANVNVSESQVLNLLSEVCEGAKEVNVQKEQSKNLKQEIVR